MISSSGEEITLYTPHGIEVMTEERVVSMVEALMEHLSRESIQKVALAAVERLNDHLGHQPGNC
jgi:hypothetical protein